ncbi:MAG: hypothetical protein B1H13_07900 [Desulfobacteraceae bacterium 4484_190.3]|nr:MAG: hypothetical protein B1H13_07900 [Desulfobacteraceae bacterium 4484_190.3]
MGGKEGAKKPPTAWEFVFWVLLKYYFYLGGHQDIVVFLWLKSSPSLNLNKIEHSAKVSYYLSVLL